MKIEFLLGNKNTLDFVSRIEIRLITNNFNISDLKKSTFLDSFLSIPLGTVILKKKNSPTTGQSVKRLI